MYSGEGKTELLPADKEALAIVFGVKKYHQNQGQAIKWTNTLEDP